jgi:hypothetical protein
MDRSPADWKQGPIFRRAVVGLAVVVATVAADLATFTSRLDGLRVLSFSSAGILAAAVAILSSEIKKTLFPGVHPGPPGSPRVALTCPCQDL